MIRFRGFRAALVASMLTLPAAAQAQQPVPNVPLRSGAVRDTLRPFFDSLASRRAPLAVAPIALAPDTAGTVAWLDLLQDSALVGLVRDALRNNNDLRLAQARIREYRAILGVDRAGLFPQIDVNAGVAKQQTVFGTLGSFSFDSWRVTADLSWELDFWGRIRRTMAGARADLGAQEDDRRATLLSLIANVAQGYLELRELDEKRAIAERTLVSRRATLRLAERRLSEGLISELDVRQFEAEVAAPAARVAEFTRDLVQKEHQLSLLVGRAPGPIARGRPLVEVARAVTVPDSVTSLLVTRRPDVARAEHDIEAASARAGAAKLARLPRFLVTGQYGSQADEPGNLFDNNSEIYTIQGGISIPLFNGGRLKNQQAAAEARSEQARIRYEQTVLVALREVSDALVGVRSSRDQVVAQDVQARALRRAFELAEKRYDAGIASYLEVLDAQRGLFNAELALTESQRQYLVSAVTLYRALGGSWNEK